ncbi:MAG: DUF5677 domain-containing protein [Bacilli bacterium]|jgi:hypothetical protein|nr:DUF5677 domain-containing protein [Bacilli bacterium]
MKIKKIERENFDRVLTILNAPNITNHDYVYEVYSMANEAIKELVEQNILKNIQPINPVLLTGYVLGEYIYSVERKSLEEKKVFEDDQEIKNQMAGVVADKYLSGDYFNYKEKRITNKFMPPMSSLDLYLNFMLNMLNTYPKNDPSSTLIVDLLIKSISLARCVVELLENGHETEAMASWRTLHECESTLLVLDRFGEAIIQKYLKHMKYGIAFKIGKNNREQTEKIFEEIKKEMKEHNLKSKDTKKYIEYGWLYGTNVVPDSELKLNFRDGLETVAGLHQYSAIYETSSEIVHSTPMLIYSNKTYYYLLALISTYESFFRIEKIFTNLFGQKITPAQRAQYNAMRNVYYSQLIAIHRKESDNLKDLKNRTIKK